MAAAGDATRGMTMFNNSSLASSSLDLLLAVPRLARRAGSLAFLFVPDQIDGLFGKMRTGGSVIAEPTTSDAANATITQAAAFIADARSSASASAQSGASDGSGGIFSFYNIRSVSGIVNYALSRWAVSTVVVAILLNRTQVYASSRIPLQLRWYVRVGLYILPILAMLRQTHDILRAMRCQTSPDWPLLRYGDPDKHMALDYGAEAGFLHWVSSRLLFWESDAASCVTVNMADGDRPPIELSGSMSRLWPLFISLCLSQFVETLACALQGRQPQPETGMTIFEHSLAFAEAEALVTIPFDFALAGTDRNGTTTAEDGVKLALSRLAVAQMMNTSPEVLLISLISSLSHLSSNVLAVLGLRDRCRLVNTGIAGLAYMAAFLWTCAKAVFVPSQDTSIFRFPTVYLLGFVPHILILLGTLACAAIYGLALVLTALCPPADLHVRQTVRERFTFAYRNLQANVHLTSGSPITVSWRDDFYTTLLKAGFTILTAASEAVYLNEGTHVQLGGMTWLEENRIDALSARRKVLQRMSELTPPEIRNDLATSKIIDYADGHPEVSPSGTPMRSGYARERKTRTPRAQRERVAREIGVGFAQRRGRFVMVLDFGKGIFWVSMGLCARAFLAMIQTMGLPYRPGWLTRLAGQPRARPIKDAQPPTVPRRNEALEFWMLSDEGSLRLPEDAAVDVEAETRRRLNYSGQLDVSGEDAEAAVSSYLYQWWKNNGWWGEIDSSGDYAPRQVDVDEDATSDVSMSTTSTTTSVYDSTSHWSDASSTSSGRRTPTQERPYPKQSGIRTPTTSVSENVLTASRLARLLDPETATEKEEAIMLSRRLRSDGPLTRSAYHRGLTREQSRVLAHAFNPTREKQTAEEEERALERFILQRRGLTSKGSQRLTGVDSGPWAGAETGESATWESGSAGMGSGGPQCVICHSSPRTILMWPCGCLSLCDECRVGLAARNFATCVCCRTNVVAYSRLYVP